MDHNNEREQLQAEESGLEADLEQAIPEGNRDPLPIENVQLLAPYFCRHCKDYVRGGVITICGHIFCWTCLWPLLADNPSPDCPQCQTRLILHMDIIPFHGQGPNARPQDTNVLAEPGAVPRPSGIYFRGPDEDKDENHFAGITEQMEAFRELILKMKVKLSFPLVELSYLKLLQLTCVLLMFLLWSFVLVT
ncbi:uncharacterized protein [Drosophila kikkawai]|uniref:RING-type E3 ubiquitin transferase n=1 Tax=Drosophila kikkawai TaxID=30033 RepID=A0A6P4IBI0_DROKI|nr:uncharacterized protein LOC108073182 [Drosophila kikkawai]XP_017020177.1 uncharacterized protein LOC108073182 [Drosophila kikkawai]